MKEDWIEQQRQKLEGHRKTPPAGLWEGICEQMGLTPEPVRQSLTIKRWHWVAAAAVIALVGLFMVYQFQSKPEKSLSSINSKQSTRSTSSKSSGSLLKSEPSISPKQSVDSKSTVNSKQSICSKQSVRTEPSVNSECSPLLAEEIHSDDGMPQQSYADTDTLQQTESSPIPANPVTHSYSHFEGNQTSYATSPTSPLDKWSLGVNASGGLLAANTSQQTGYLNDKFYSDANFASNASATNYVSEHHLPIRFGLSVNYQLTPLLALHSGISYTYLYSEFSVPLYKNDHYDQRLHYLGIPLGVTWQLWSANHFRFYVSGGMMLEKCVSGKMDGNSVSPKPWQWSVEAAAGAEYTFTPQFGFYLEPSLGYYFNDGSSLEHYYKEHPWTPSLEFGLRLHLNKGASYRMKER